ncbi:MAG TPA: hypothetical protein VGE93_05980, partial [Bryobacteraceae bacterium]
MSQLKLSKKTVAVLFVVASAATLSCAKAQTGPATSPLPPSELYGDLYRQVQLAHLYPDSKTFADMVPNES